MNTVLFALQQYEKRLHLQLSLRTYGVVQVDYRQSTSVPTLPPGTDPYGLALDSEPWASEHNINNIYAHTHLAEK